MTSNCLMTIKDVAKLLQTSDRSIRRWISTGDFPPGIQIAAGSVRWKREDIDNWLENRAKAGSHA